MSIQTKIAAVAIAALTVGASVAATTSSAQAKPLGWGWGVGAGIATAAIVGTAVAASNPYPYGYHRCGWVARYDAFAPATDRSTIPWILRPARAPHPPRVVPRPARLSPERVVAFRQSNTPAMLPRSHTMMRSMHLPGELVAIKNYLQ